MITDVSWIKSLEIEQYKRSLYKFTLKAFEVMHNGAKPQSNWHIEVIADVMQQQIERVANGIEKEKDTIINIPPRSLKSFVCSVCAVAWAWVNYPSTNFICVSYSAELAIELSVLTRDLIQSEWYIESFPDIKLRRGDNAKKKFQNTYGGKRFATSTTGAATGKGADIIVFDDVMNVEIATSDALRATALRTINTTFSSRFDNAKIGANFFIEQRLHEEDATGTALKDAPQDYDHYSFPATSDGFIHPEKYEKYYKEVEGESVKYLFPERFSKKVLDRLARKQGDYAYAGQYLQRPAPLEGGIIKKDWFNIVGLSDFQSVSKGVTWNFFLDTAYTTKSTNDPTAIICAGTKQNKLFVKKVSVFRLELPELLETIKSYVRDNGYSTRSRIYIEPKASGKSIVQTLRRQTGLNVLESKAPDVDKVTRAFAITPHIQNGRVYLCDGGGWVNGFLDECATFPNGKHDDQVDVLVMACDKLNVSAMMKG